VRLLTGEMKSKQALIAELSTDARPTPFRLSVPLDVIGTDAPHDIVLRHLGCHLELFAGGVLVDEEWPLGSRLPAEGAVGAAGDTVMRIACGIAA